LVEAPSRRRSPAGGQCGKKEKLFLGTPKSKAPNPHFSPAYSAFAEVSADVQCAMLLMRRYEPPG
jgi:hypothetical protein